jgi:hypothetical protein
MSIKYFSLPLQNVTHFDHIMTDCLSHVFSVPKQCAVSRFYSHNTRMFVTKWWCVMMSGGQSDALSEWCGSCHKWSIMWCSRWPWRCNAAPQPRLSLDQVTSASSRVQAGVECCPPMLDDGVADNVQSWVNMMLQPHFVRTWEAFCNTILSRLPCGCCRNTELAQSLLHYMKCDTVV